MGCCPVDNGCRDLARHQLRASCRCAVARRDQFVVDGDLFVSADDVGAAAVRFIPDVVVPRATCVGESGDGPDRCGISYIRPPGQRGDSRHPVAECMADVATSSARGVNSIGCECNRHDVLRIGPRLRVRPGVRVVDVWSGLGIFGAAYGRTVGGCSACSIARVSYALLQLRFRGGSVSLRGQLLRCAVGSSGSLSGFWRLVRRRP